MTIKKSKLIEFVNLINECCSVMDDNEVSNWINLPNPNLNMQMPIDVFNEEGTDRIYRLLYFIEIGEADLY